MKNKCLPGFRGAIVFLFLTATQNLIAAPAPIVTSTQSGEDRPDGVFGIGLTGSVTHRPFIGVGNQFTLLPYFSYKNGDFFVESLDVGYVLASNRALKLDLLATPRFYEVKSSFAKNGELDGIDQTNPTYMAGFSMQVRSSFAVYTLQYFHDLIESDGNEAVLTASKAIEVNSSMTLIPSIGATYQDTRLVDHFYGVQSNEVRSGRPLYEGKSTVNYNITLNAVYSYSRHLDMLGQVKYEHLGDGITESPIIDKSNVYAITIGAVYRY